MISPIRSRTRLRLRPSASTSATRSAEEVLMGAVEAKQIDPSSKSDAGTKVTENTESGQFLCNNGAATANKRPPIDCGDLDMRIARDGTWYYRGSPIGRLALVKLFASVLAARGGRPLLAGYAGRARPHRGRGCTLPRGGANGRLGEGRAQELIFRTNLDEFVTAGPRTRYASRRRRSGEPAPYILVRGPHRGEACAAGVL